MINTVKDVNLEDKLNLDLLLKLEVYLNKYNRYLTTETFKNKFVHVLLVQRTEIFREIKRYIKRNDFPWPRIPTYHMNIVVACVILVIY